MSDYKALEEVELKYIASKVGEHHYKMEQPPRETEKWFYAIPGNGFLVKLNGKSGFLCSHHEHHMGQPEGTDGYTKAMMHGKRTDESALNLLNEVAQELEKREIDCEVFICEYAGDNHEHRLSIFIKQDYEIKEVSRIIEMLKQVIDELTVAKWNSFVDLFD